MLNSPSDAATILERTRRRDELEAEVQRLLERERRNSPGRRRALPIAGLAVAAIGALAAFFLEGASFLFAAAVEVLVVCVVLLFALAAYARWLRTRRLQIEVLLDLERRMEAREAQADRP